MPFDEKWLRMKEKGEGKKSTRKVKRVRKLKKKIEETRQRLNEAIEEDVSSEKVLELSRELDFLVEQYLEQIGK